MTDKGSSILAGIAFGVLFGIFVAVRFEIQVALTAGSISGLIFGLAIYFFFSSKNIAKQTQIEDIDGEPIIHSGRANHFKGMEAVGGKLYLLKDKVQFQPHNFNIQSHSESIDINHIQKVSFYNSFGFISNGIAIKKMMGRQRNLLLKTDKFGRKKLKN